MRVELIQSLGKFQAHTIETTRSGSGDYFADFTETPTGNFRSVFSIKISKRTDENKDLIINDWVFDKVVTFRDSSSFYDNYFNSFEINGITPDGEEFSFLFQNMLREQKPTEVVFNTIYLISCCNNTNEAYILARAFDYYPTVRDLSKNTDYIISVSKELQEAFTTLEELISQKHNENFLVFVKRTLVKKMKQVNEDLIKYCTAGN